MDFLVQLINTIDEKSITSYIYVFAFSLLIFRIPLISRLLRVFYTLFHETGHSLAAFFTNSKTLHIKLHYNLSGLILTKSSNKFKQFIITIAGYPFAAFCACILFWLLHNNYEIITLFSITGLVFIQLLLNLRNSFGIIWSLFVLTMLISLYFYLNQYIFHVLILLASVITLESVVSSSVIFYYSIINPQKAGDAFNLSKITGIHSIFWGLLFIGVSLWFLYLTSELIFLGRI